MKVSFALSFYLLAKVLVFGNASNLRSNSTVVALMEDEEGEDLSFSAEPLSDDYEDRRQLKANGNNHNNNNNKNRRDNSNGNGSGGGGGGKAKISPREVLNAAFTKKEIAKLKKANNNKGPGALVRKALKPAQIKALRKSIALKKKANAMKRKNNLSYPNLTGGSKKPKNLLGDCGNWVCVWPLNALIAGAITVGVIATSGAIDTLAAILAPFTGGITAALAMLAQVGIVAGATITQQMLAELVDKVCCWQF